MNLWSFLKNTHVQTKKSYMISILVIYMRKITSEN